MGKEEIYYEDAGQYEDYEIIHHLEGTFMDSHPGDIHHEHAFERITAKRIVSFIPVL